MTDTEMAEYFRKMFSADCARISRPCGNLFLILGTKRNTARDREADASVGQWFSNGEPIDFDYVAERVVAHGTTFKALLKMARAYKRLFVKGETRR